MPKVNSNNSNYNAKHIYERDKEDDIHYDVGDIVLVVVMMIFYLIGWGMTISAIVEKYTASEPPTNVHLYVVFLIVPHLLAGGKNLHYWWREQYELDDEERSNMSMLVHVICWPVSPMLRLFNSLRLGISREDDYDWDDDGRRFVSEATTAGTLLLFDAFLGDGPILTLLFRDDIWLNSATWQSALMGDDVYSDTGMKVYVSCLPEDYNNPNRAECVNSNPESSLYWPVARIIILCVRISLTYTFYNMMIKRYQRIQYEEYFSHIQNDNSRIGKVNPFGWVFYMFGNLGYAASRSMGYAMVSASAGGWIYLICGMRWLTNTVWGLIVIVHSNGVVPARSVSPIIMGGAWLYGLTNEHGGPQLGRYVLYYAFSFVESAVCSYIWIINMAGSGDFFAVKAPWAMLAVFLTGIILNVFYYSLCHPGKPGVSPRGFLCCSGDRRAHELEPQVTSI